MDEWQKSRFKTPLGLEVGPGQQLDTRLHIATQYDYTEAMVPVRILRGEAAGPTLFVSSTIHGDELNGIEIIRRVIHHRALRRLRGTLIVVPIVNIFGFHQQSRYLPDRRDLNRLFPGSSSGSLGSRLAHMFTDQILKQSDYGIDLHTGAQHKFNIPQIRANFHDKIITQLAPSFQIPVMLHAGIRDGSLREVGEEFNKPIFLFVNHVRFSKFYFTNFMRYSVVILPSLILSNLGRIKFRLTIEKCSINNLPSR
jgi:hypothetical protein